MSHAPPKKGPPGERRPEVESNSNFTATAAEVKRPGISPQTLAAAKVRQIDATQAEELCGMKAAGLWIPYPGVKDYGRLRLDTPTPSQKYHQRAGSDVHAYMTPSALEGPKGGDLAIIEGEFKALSLEESGLVAIGISGFFGFQSGSEIVPELDQALRRIKPERILFFGDSDTALNSQFATAAIRLQDMTGLPVFLPRIPLDQPKGIDDCREEMGRNFPGFLSDAIETAVEIEPGMTPPQLSVELLEQERDRLKAGTFGMSPTKAKRRLVEIGAAAEKDALAFDSLYGLLDETGISGKRAFQNAVKQLKETRRKEAANREPNPKDHKETVVKRFAFDGRAYYRDREERWEKMERMDLLLTVDAMGFPRTREQHETRSPAENILLSIQNDRRAEYAGPICGRRAGMFDEGGRRILATAGPKIVEAAPDPLPGPLFDFFAGLFGKGQDDKWELQLGLFLGWLKQARRALADPTNHLPGHLLGLIGPRDCGKSLGQDLITLCIGGRSADASTWLQNRTDFNAQLWGAEHLILSDAYLEDDPRVKKSFRDAIKGAVANPVYPLARKYADEISLRPIWRLSLSANDDPQSAGVIPSPIADPSLADKILYLKGFPPLKPFHGDEPQDRLKFWQSLVADLPTFCGLVDSFAVDEEWQKGRFGVSEWLHPDIAELLDSSNPDREIIEFLSDWIESAGEDAGEWSGRAKDLFAAIDDHSDGDFRRQACRNSLVLSHAMKRIAGLPDWKGRIEIKHDRFGPNRQPGLRFTINSANRIGLDG